jgi:hypothetical protein
MYHVQNKITLHLQMLYITYSVIHVPAYYTMQASRAHEQKAHGLYYRHSQMDFSSKHADSKPIISSPYRQIRYAYGLLKWLEVETWQFSY